MNHSFSLHCFLFKCSIPFQCFWWLNDSMLMLATVKKKKVAILYIFGHEGCELFRMNGLSLYWYLDEQDGFMWRYLNARMKLRLSRRMLDLKYQQSEPDFVRTLSQGDQILVCYSANCLCMGRVTVCGNILSHFWRE